VPIVVKSGRLNILGPAGPVQACKGIALSNIQQLVGFIEWYCQ